MATREPRPVPWLDRLDDGTYRTIPGHVQQVRRAFELYLEGWTPTEIALELEGNWDGKRGDQPAWDLKKVGRLLSNEVVVGDFAWDKKLGSKRPIQRNKLPALITRSEFEQTQAMLQADSEGLKEFIANLETPALRGRSLAEVDLFHGLCFCYECGQRLTPKRLDQGDVWVPVTEPLDDTAVLATKPVSDMRPVTVVWKQPSLSQPNFVEGKRHERELRFDLKSKSQDDEMLVTWVRTPEGADKPTVLRRKAAKDPGFVFWECECEGVGDVPAFFIEDFVFEVLMPAIGLDLTRAFQLARLEVASRAQLAEEQAQLRHLAEELGRLDISEITQRLERLKQAVCDVAEKLPCLTLQADKTQLIARHKDFRAGTISVRERELVRRRLWAAGTKVFLLRVPGISSPDHKFVLTGKLVERWGAATAVETAAMLVHLRDGQEVLTKPWRLNGATTPVT